MAASGGYLVIVNELLTAAKAHKTHGDDVKQALSYWRKTAKLDNGVFGRLSISPKIAGGYQEFYDQVTKDVTRLYQALYSGAGTLALTAVAYMLAEAKVMQYLAEVKQDNKYLSLADSGKAP
jgi:hypothetical protein